MWINFTKQFIKCNHLITSSRFIQLLGIDNENPNYHFQSKLVRSLIRTGANIHNCEMGDTVVVQWGDRYSTHMLYNKGPYLHFLHADSIMSLGIKDKASNTEPFLGRVVQREFCLVRKVS